SRVGALRAKDVQDGVGQRLRFGGAFSVKGGVGGGVDTGEAADVANGGAGDRQAKHRWGSDLAGGDAIPPAAQPGLALAGIRQPKAVTGRRLRGRPSALRVHQAEHAGGGQEGGDEPEAALSLAEVLAAKEDAPVAKLRLPGQSCCG